MTALPTREYFWRVLATVKPAYHKDLIDHAIKQRSDEGGETKREAAIAIKSEWLAKLMSAQIAKGKSMFVLTTLD